MCRWLAYAGSPVRLDKMLYSHGHSLIDQSPGGDAPQEGVRARISRSAVAKGPTLTRDEDECAIAQAHQFAAADPGGARG